MAYLILPHRWTRQPQVPVEIDRRWNIPFAHLLLPSVGGSMMLDACGTPQQQPVTNTLVPGISAGGRSLSNSGSLVARYVYRPRATSAYTWIATVVKTGSASYRNIFNISDSGNLYAYQARVESNLHLDFYSSVSGVDKLARVSDTEAADNVVRCYAGTSDGVNIKVFANGRLGQTTSSGLTTRTLERIWFNSEAGGGSNFWLGHTHLFAILPDTVLADDELIEITQHYGWPLFAPIQRRIYVGSSAGATGVIVNPGVGAISVTGLAPTLRTSTSITTNLGALTITGYAPTVSTSTSIATGVGALSITGLASSLSTATSIATSAGALAITGYAPTVSSVSALTAAAGVGQLSVTGYAPTVTVIAAGAIAPNAGALSITGLQPAISLQERIATGVAALEIVGYAPTVSSAVTIQTGVGTLSIAGYAPTAETLKIITAGVGGIVITGYEPTVTGGEAVPTGRADAGAPGPSRRKYSTKNRKRKPLLVTIDGEDFVVSTEAEAEALIEQAHEVAEEAAKSQAAEVVKKRLAKQAKDGRLNTRPVELDQPEVKVAPADDGYIDKTWLAEVQRKFDEEISEAYQEAAQQAELQILMRRQVELDEEDQLVALLFTIL